MPDAELWAFRSSLNAWHFPSDPTHTTCLKTSICGLHGVILPVKEHWPGQPSRVMLSVRINEPAAPAFTLTEAPVVEPLMVPSPLIDQLCFTVPAAGLTVEA